jgi:hypothetical protein
MRTQLKPCPHFGLTTFAEDDRHVARVIVRDEEVAAILDGVSLTEPRVTIPLLRLVMAEVGKQMQDDLTDEGGWSDSMECADDIRVLAARLPLAAGIHKRLMAQCENDDMSMAESEGWDAEIRELFVGKLPGFAITGKERDVLVREVRATLKAIDFEGKRRELKAILRDTGKKKGTGEACTLSTLPMPELVEWLRRLGPDITAQGFHSLPKKRRKKLARRHGVIRDMWLRLGREIQVGPKG